jgi:hypothetical protein
MKTLSILVGLIVFFSISISISYAGGTQIPSPQQDTPTFNDMATAILNPPDNCVTPIGPNDWTITESCVLNSNFNAPRNVIVQNGALLIISNGVILDIDFSSRNITVEFGSGVLIKAGGSIT